MGGTKDILVNKLEVYEGFANVKKFIDSNIDTFKSINPHSLASSSKVVIQGGKIQIDLIHASDVDTIITLFVDKSEIRIVCAGFTDSMFYQFPHLKGSEYYEAVGRYFKAALGGCYLKNVYVDGSGTYQMARLIWDDASFKEIVYGSIWSHIRNWLFRIRFQNRVFRYSSFL